MAAQAIPSYAPQQAAPYFNKLECFCFNQYTLDAGEKKQWPVAFVIDPKISKDVRTITLSYTFFEVGGKTPPAPTAAALQLTRRAAFVMGQQQQHHVAAPRRDRCGEPSRPSAGGFFGVRKNSDYKEDIARLTPLHIVAVGLVAVVIFVVGPRAAGQVRDCVLNGFE